MMVAEFIVTTLDPGKKCVKDLDRGSFKLSSPADGRSERGTPKPPRPR